MCWKKTQSKIIILMFWETRSKIEGLRNNGLFYSATFRPSSHCVWQFSWMSSILFFEASRKRKIQTVFGSCLLRRLKDGRPPRRRRLRFFDARGLNFISVDGGNIGSLLENVLESWRIFWTCFHFVLISFRMPVSYWVMKTKTNRITRSSLSQ